MACPSSQREPHLEVLAPLEGGAGFGGDARSPGGQSRWSAGRESTWVSLDPVLVCEVTYLEMTKSTRKMRAPVFLRMREDKLPEDCVLEPLVSG